MPRAKLIITVPEQVWIGNVSRTYPDAQFRVLAALPDDGRGFGLLEVSSPDLDAITGDIDGFETVSALSILSVHDQTALMQFETTTPVLLFPLQRAGIPLEMPFTIQDGEAVWELTASHEDLSTLGEQFDALGIEFRVAYFHQSHDEDRVLTDNQQELIETAVDLGYYDTPRECTLTELAEHLGLAKSSVSETLHRAEERIVKSFVQTLPAESPLDASKQVEPPGPE